MYRHTGIIIAAFLLVFLPLSVRTQTLGIGPIGITVRDIDRSVRFYCETLGFKKVSDTELLGKKYEDLEGVFALRIRVVRLQIGDEYVELTGYLTAGGRSMPEDARSNDLIFQHLAIVVSDMDKAYRQLRRHGLLYVSTAPQTIPASNKAAAGVRAFYFHDPDGHNLELIWFPPGKGQPKWQVHSPNPKLFLGIDHSAIAITNTDTSLHFYCDLLGLQRKGDSYNFGTEQEHLSSVEGASLHITGLRSPAGPGIEFLQYLQPRPGKPYPADSRANDIWHWQTMIFVTDAARLFEEFRTLGYSFVSRGLITFGKTAGHEKQGFIVRDPDGHALLILQN